MTPAVRNTLILLLWHGSTAYCQVEQIWLTHRGHDPDRLVVNWTTKTPGDSEVRFGLTAAYGQAASVSDNVTLHHVEIPTPARDAEYHYSVRSGKQISPDAAFKAYPSNVLRIAVVADWAGKPDLQALIKEDVHLLLTAGDNIGSLHQTCGAGAKGCVKPYAALVGRYPDLFRSTPCLPVLGNHDREIRERGTKPPEAPVYDVEAQAFREFFELPDDEWKWSFDAPAFGLRLVALDLSHLSDQGTTWQTCHELRQGSPQFDWYRNIMNDTSRPFVVTLYNERNSTVRSQEQGAWGRMISQGTLAITGFGYFAERADVNGFPYYNTSLNGTGAKYPDPQSRFFAGEDSFLLLTVQKNPPRLTVKIQNLQGAVLDQQQYQPKRRTPGS